MDIKVELLKDYISDFVQSRIEDFVIDASQIADTTATRILSEIQAVLQDDDKTDFDVVDEIICIFEKYHIRTGTRHDF